MELKEMIAPYWSPEHNGVVIPLLNKVLDLKNLSDQPRNRWENKELAKQAGKELMTNEDFHILYWQRNEINEILAEHGGDLLIGWFGTSTECSDYYCWIVSFGSGICNFTLVINSYVGRGLVAL